MAKKKDRRRIKCFDCGHFTSHFNLTRRYGKNMKPRAVFVCTDCYKLRD